MTDQSEERQAAHLSKIIQREVAYFNGWWVSEESMKKSCRIAADKVLRYLAKRKKRNVK